MSLNVLRCGVVGGRNVQKMKEISHFLTKKLPMLDSRIRNYAKVMNFYFFSLKIFN